MLPAVEAQSLNYWTAREAPRMTIIKIQKITNVGEEKRNTGNVN